MEMTSAKRFELFSRVAVIVILAITAIVCVAWTVSTPRSFDDYIYCTEFSGIHELMVLDSLGADVETVPQAIRSAVNHYGSENGRLSNILYILCGPVGRIPPAVFCGFIMALMALLMAMWGRKGRYPTLPAVIVAVWLLWCGFPWYNYFQSLDYHANYVWPSVTMLAVMYLVVSSRDLGRWRMVWALLLAFVTGWMHESFNIALGVWLLVYMVMNGRLRSVKLWSVIICLAVGGLMNICGGTFVRAAESNAVGGIARLGAIAKQLLLQLWPFYLAVAVAVSAALRGRRREVMQRYFPMLAASAVIAVMSMVLGMVDRVLWPLDLLCSLVIIAECNRLTGASWPRFMAIGSVAAFVIYCLWAVELVRWQKIVSDDVDRVERLLSPRSENGTTVAFCDYTTSADVPFYLMSMTLPPLEDAWNSECMGAYYRRGRVTSFVATPESKGRPFDEWSDIPGNTSAKGRWPMIATRDTSMTSLKLTFSAPQLQKMAPVNILYMLQAGQSLNADGVATVPVEYTPVVLPEGDTVYSVKIAIPRFFNNREFIKIDRPE